MSDTDSEITRTPKGTQEIVLKSPGGSSSKSLVAFKKPTPPPPKKSRIVLEEDKYSEELERIVQRDFFPDLEKLKAQNAYLSALENNDVHMLRELYSKYTLGKNTPRMGTARTGSLDTPSTFETPIGSATDNPSETPTHLPMENPESATDNATKAETDKTKQLTVNQFLNTYTSEDNQSFKDIMEESDRKHRMKYSWLYEAEGKHAIEAQKALALPSIEEQAEGFKRPLNLDTWSYKNKNYLMYVPEGVAFSAEEELEMAKKQPEVILKNTRFVENPFKMPKQPQSLTDGSGTPKIFKLTEGRIGVDGKEVDSSTPKVNSYGFVRTPSPTPGVEESPFMTWGEIEGTPFRLDGSDTPVPAVQSKPFKLQNTSKRDKLALELAEKVSHRYRDKKLKAIEAARSHLGTPSPRPGSSSSSLDRLHSMSPAAQKFAKSHLGSRLISDKALRESYTPKPATPRGGLKTPTPSSSTPAKTVTPLLGSRSSTPSSTRGCITDNLLNLPKTTSSRPKASDFF